MANERVIRQTTNHPTETTGLMSLQVNFHPEHVGAPARASYGSVGSTASRASIASIASTAAFASTGSYAAKAGLPAIASQGSAGSTGSVGSVAAIGRNATAASVASVASVAGHPEIRRTYWDASAGGGGISNVVEDLTPELGGDLDILSQKIISSTSNIFFESNNYYDFKGLNSAVFLQLEDGQMTTFRDIVANGTRDLGNSSGGAFEDLWLDGEIASTGDVTIAPEDVSGELVVQNEPAGARANSVRISHDGTNGTITTDGVGGGTLIIDSYSGINFRKGGVSGQMANFSTSDCNIYNDLIASQDFHHKGTQLGFYNVAKANQPAHIADPTDLATCITAITSLNAMCATLGLTAVS